MFFRTPLRQASPLGQASGVNSCHATTRKHKRTVHPVHLNLVRWSMLKITVLRNEPLMRGGAGPLTEMKKTGKQSRTPMTRMQPFRDPRDGAREAGSTDPAVAAGHMRGHRPGGAHCLGRRCNHGGRTQCQHPLSLRGRHDVGVQPRQLAHPQLRPVLQELVQRRAQEGPPHVLGQRPFSPCTASTPNPRTAISDPFNPRALPSSSQPFPPENNSHPLTIGTFCGMTFWCEGLSSRAIYNARKVPTACKTRSTW